MGQLYLNNAHARLATNISNTATTVQLTDVANFPTSLASGEWFLLTLYKPTSRYGENIEVVKVTGWNGSSITCIRGHERPAVSHSGGELVESRVTASMLQAQEDAVNLKVAIADVVDGLTSIASEKPLSANQGRVLKGYIDNINAVLQSDTSTLNELQEIVDYIQLNRADLESLGISNIAGLQNALNGKVDKVTGKALSSNDYTDTEKSKLAGIESGATADQTKADIDALGVDSDTLDGQHGTYYQNASNLNAGTINDARLPANITSNITGNATTATRLATARTITLGGDLSGFAAFNGSANITITGTVADNSHNHMIANVDGLANELGNKLELAGTDFNGTYPLTVVANGNILSNPKITYSGIDNDLKITDGSITHKSGTEGCRVEYNATSKSLEYNFF